jgi:hypothetical protein
MGSRAIRLQTAGAEAVTLNSMHKLLAITLTAVALAACTSTTTTSPSSMGNTSNPAETKNSTDANKVRNPAAVSPGGADAGAAGTGTGAGAGTGTGTK